MTDKPNTIKRISINIVLITAFGTLMVVFCSLFGADINFIRAKSFEIRNQWSRAQDAYKNAVFFDPFNTEYIKGLANFFWHRSDYRKDKLKLLKQAQRLYQRILELNPHYAQHMVDLGRIQIKIFLEDKEIYSGKLREGLENFERALKRDPNGARTAYYVGLAGIEVWDHLDENERAMAINRLRHALSYRWPQYFKSYYQYVWDTTQDFTLLEKMTPQNLRSYKVLYNFIEKNNLWQLRKSVSEAIKNYMSREDPQGFAQEQNLKMSRIEDLKKKSKLAARAVTNLISSQSWQGISRYHDHVYNNGNMYWAGTIDGVLRLPEGESIIKIQAKGMPAQSIYPYMVVELDGIEIGESFVDNLMWKEYSFEVNTSSGIKVLSITYENDRVYGEKRENRNLYIKDAWVVR